MRLSQMIVRIREIDGFLEDIGVADIYDYTLENGVIEFKMKPEFGDYMFVIGEITPMNTVIELVDDLKESYKKVMNR